MKFHQGDKFPMGWHWLEVYSVTEYGWIVEGGEGMSHPVRALWQAFHPSQSVTSGPEACAVCALSTPGPHSSSGVMAETFVRYDVFRRPDSPVVCDACAWYFDGEGIRTGGEKHPPFQKLSYAVVGDRFLDLSRDDARALIDSWPDGPPDPAYLVLTRVKKKHLILHAKCWMPGGPAVIGWEESAFQVTMPEMRLLRTTIDALLAEGVGKTAILSGQLPGIVLRKHPEPARLITLMASVACWRPSPAFEFFVWLALTPEKKEVLSGATAPRVHAGRQPALPLLPRD